MGRRQWNRKKATVNPKKKKRRKDERVWFWGDNLGPTVLAQLVTAVTLSQISNLYHI